jgi:uncharacterized protein (TIGR03067 family)
MRALIATVFLTALFLTAAAQEPEKKSEPEKQPEKKTDKGPALPTDPALPDPKGPPTPIEGGYTIASGERDGKPIPAERIKDAIVRLTGGRIVGTDRDRVELLVATYTLDTEKTPWALELRHYEAPDQLSSGLVKKDGNVLTIIFALPGGAAPTEFKTKEKQVMFVLRRFVLDPVPPPNKFGNAP